MLQKHLKTIDDQHRLVLDVVLGAANALGKFSLPLLATVGGFWVWNSVLPHPDVLQLVGLGLYGALLEIPILYYTLRK